VSPRLAVLIDTRRALQASVEVVENLEMANKRIAELENGMEEMRGGFAELHAKLAESEARNTELKIILDSDAGDVPELKRRAEADAKRIAKLEKEVKDYKKEIKRLELRVEEVEEELEECQEERDDYEGQHESAELALEMAEKKFTEELRGRDERIAELEEALGQEQEEVEDTRATLERKSESLRVCARVEDGNLKRIAELTADCHEKDRVLQAYEEEMEKLNYQLADYISSYRDAQEKLEASHTEIKRIAERSRAKDAELDEKDCELAEVRENMKELLHGYLAENARANKAGHELLKKLEEAEEAEARQAGEDLKEAMAKAGWGEPTTTTTTTTTTTEKVTYIGSINTESASFKRYIASLPEDERREIMGEA
jgi:chromosome segregation ATPase